MKRSIIIILLSVISIASCKRQKMLDVQQQDKSIKDLYYEKMTLQQFAETRVPYEKNFLLNTPLIDNTIEYYNYIHNNLNNKSAQTAKPKFRFKWPGIIHPHITGTGGCEVPLGICIIFGGGATDGDAIQVSAGIIDNKLVIIYPTDVNSNFGLTADGYLPLLFDIDIPLDIADSLGINSDNPKIKSGIYKAYYDQNLNKYTGIALDIKM